MLKDARFFTVRGCAPACRLLIHHMLSQSLSLGADRNAMAPAQLHRRGWCSPAWPLLMASLRRRRMLWPKLSKNSRVRSLRRWRRSLSAWRRARIRARRLCFFSACQAPTHQ